MAMIYVYLMTIVGICWNDKVWRCTKTMKRMTLQVQVENEDINIVAVIEHQGRCYSKGRGCNIQFDPLEYCKYFIYVVNKK
jgi:hypothetical protein